MVIEIVSPTFFSITVACYNNGERPASPVKFVVTDPCSLILIAVIEDNGNVGAKSIEFRNPIGESGKRADNEERAPNKLFP